jgi:hypothetical protein
MDEWSKVLAQKMSDLELIATWASMTGYGAVRDHIRIAISKIREIKDRLEGELVNESR